MVADNPAPASLSSNFRVDWRQAIDHLERVRRDPLKTIYSAFPPSDRTEDAFAIPMDCRFGLPTAYASKTLTRLPDYGFGFVVNRPFRQPPDWGTKPEELKKSGKPKTYGYSASHIQSCPALFCEGDAGLSVERQLQAPAAAGLPPVTFAVNTTGRSVHLWWVLERDALLDDWRSLMFRLRLALEGAEPEAGWDRSLTSPVRVMRLAGSIHPKSGQRAHVIEGSNTHYRQSVFDSVLPPEPIYAKQPARCLGEGGGLDGSLAAGRWFEGQSLDQKLAMTIDMLRFIPPRGEPGSGTRETAVRVLCGLCHYYGHKIAIGICKRAEWVSDYWDPETEAERIHKSDYPAGMQTIIGVARDNGWRHPLDIKNERLLESLGNN